MVEIKEVNMALYPDVWSYLNDQVRVPIQNALKNGNNEVVEEFVDFLIMKYIELNAFAKAMEDFSKERGVKIDIPFQEYLSKYVEKYMPDMPIDWDSLDLVYSTKEKKEDEKKEFN